MLVIFYQIQVTKINRRLFELKESLNVLVPFLKGFLLLEDNLLSLLRFLMVSFSPQNQHLQTNLKTFGPLFQSLHNILSHQQPHPHLYQKHSVFAQCHCNSIYEQEYGF